MVYTTSLHDSITSICKTILPLSLKKRRIPAIAAAEQRLSKQQSDNLKWQQDSFHQMLNLMGLYKESILPEKELSAFRTHLLETLIAAPIDREPPIILRDKLIFLQELLYAKCITEEEYHASKRPLLQRLAVQGAEIDARDVIVGGAHKVESSSEEWFTIDLKEDDKCSANQDVSTIKNYSRESSTVKRMKGAAFVFGFTSSDRNQKLKEIDVNSACSKTKDRAESPLCDVNLNERESEPKSILMEESIPPPCVVAEKGKKKPSRTIFQREEGGGGGGGGRDRENKEKLQPGKKASVFDGFKRWKKTEAEAEDKAAQSLFFNKKSDEASYGGKLVADPVGEGPDTRQIKRRLHPNGAPTDFFVDKVLAENIKKQLFRIQTELTAKNPKVHLSDDQVEAISTRLPVDKADLQKHFSKSWCDQYGDIVLDVVRKEFKDHMREMGNQRNRKHNTFDDQNSHPNLLAPQANVSSSYSFTDFGTGRSQNGYYRAGSIQ